MDEPPDHWDEIPGSVKNLGMGLSQNVPGTGKWASQVAREIFSTMLDTRSLHFDGRRLILTCGDRG